jgi:ribose transport system ATP-binding protein
MVLAKWLETEPRVLLLHEPTHGVDVGARQDIYRRIEATAARGVAVVVASSDYEELPAICDRVIVFRKGAPIVELEGQFDHDTITRYCFGG